ncbi:hypothetical protein C8J57DRAFT_1508500 [Mycena rebaudengoi]|nr:hypothetical protein C8J57DRAFT_1508500 [Mycena rebaudengoi]
MPQRTNPELYNLLYQTVKPDTYSSQALQSLVKREPTVEYRDLLAMQSLGKPTHAIFLGGCVTPKTRDDVQSSFVVQHHRGIHGDSLVLIATQLKSAEAELLGILYESCPNTLDWYYELNAAATLIFGRTVHSDVLVIKNGPAGSNIDTSIDASHLCKTHRECLQEHLLSDVQTTEGSLQAPSSITGHYLNAHAWFPGVDNYIVVPLYRLTGNDVCRLFYELEDIKNMSAPVPLLRALPAKATSLLPQMTWVHIHYTHFKIKIAIPAFPRKQAAFLFPDGDSIGRRMWVRIPVLHGFARAGGASQMDTDRFIDCHRGGADSSFDVDKTSIKISRFPFNKPRDLRHTYSIVVCPQRDSGPRLYPVNTLINSMVPELAQRWRGNVLVFKHGTTNAQNIINISLEDMALIEAIVMRVIRDGLVGV